MTDIRVTGIKAEVAREVAGEARVTKVAAEVLVTESGATARMTNMYIEVLRTGVAAAPNNNKNPVVVMFGR